MWSSERNLCEVGTAASPTLDGSYGNKVWMYVQYEALTLHSSAECGGTGLRGMQAKGNLLAGGSSIDVGNYCRVLMR